MPEDTQTDTSPTPAPSSSKSKTTAPAPTADPAPAPPAQISGRAFVEETPKLSREARDILLRRYALERRTREDWMTKANELGGMQ